MQQTQKRNFNIIEPSDKFLPDALNDNTRKIEAALDAHEAAVKAVTDDLDTRIKVFEAKKFVYGTYYINQQTITVQVGFTPKLVIIHWFRAFAGTSAVAMEGDLNSGTFLKIVEGGFQTCDINGGTYLPGNYAYIAIG